MRQITKIIWHCAATREGQHVTMETIRHMHVKQNKWSDIGYHYVIELDGTVKEGRPLKRVGAHASGHNAHSIGICYVGGMDADYKKPKDTRTPEQKAALYELTERLLEDYPKATVHGHNEFANKACPSFDVQEDWAAHKGVIEPEPSTDREPELSPDITPGLTPDDMDDEDFDPGWPAEVEGPKS